LLTKGYTDGLLDFNYRNRLSHGREEFLLAQIEQRMMTEVIQTRAVTSAILATINPKAMVEKALTAVNDYSQMALPYLAQKGTLDTKSLDKKELDGIKNRLAEARKKAQQAKP
jgi:hypothetical protein